MLPRQNKVCPSRAIFLLNWGQVPNRSYLNEKPILYKTDIQIIRNSLEVSGLNFGCGAMLKVAGLNLTLVKTVKLTVHPVETGYLGISPSWDWVSGYLTQLRLGIWVSHQLRLVSHPVETGYLTQLRLGIWLSFSKVSAMKWEDWAPPLMCGSPGQSGALLNTMLPLLPLWSLGYGTSSPLLVWPVC